jgi:hypothetical protein
VPISQISRYITNHSLQSVTLPHIPSYPSYYIDIENDWKKLTTPYLANRTSSLATIAFQPLPKSIGIASTKNGGNAMGLTANDHDRFVLEITALWSSKEDDEILADIHRKFTDRLLKQLEVLKARIPTVGKYNPYFMNDASGDQDVYGSFKDSAKFRAIQKQVDPNGLWQRAGGHKFH